MNKKFNKKIGDFKLVALLKTFSNLEIKRFSRFLQSPYHNNKALLITLFEVIRPFYPSFAEPKFDRQKIWKDVYGTKSFNAEIFKKIFFELNALAESFLVIEQVKNNQRIKDKLLIEALNPRNFARFEKESKALISKIKAKKALQLQDDFLDLHLLQRNLWYHIEKEKHQVDNSELAENYYYLYTYSAFEKLKTISEIATRKKYLNTADSPFVLDLKTPIDASVIQSNTTLTLINQFKNFITTPSLSVYLSLRDKLLGLKNVPDRSILQDGILHLNNYLVGEDQKGKLSQINESFELFKWAAEQKIFVVNEYIQEEIMVNTTIFAVINQQTGWATNYINDHKIYLRSKDRALTIKYLRTVVSFAEQDFEKVIQLQATLQPGKAMHYYLSIKSMLTRSFFELLLQGHTHYSDTLIAQLDALEKGLRRNWKFSENRINGYRNFLKVFRKLYALFLLPSQNGFLQLEAEISRTAPLIGGAWFRKKVELLKKRSRN